MNLARTFLDDLRFGPLGARFRDELTVDKGSRESSERRLYEDENLVESFSASSSSWLVLQLEVEDLSSLLFRTLISLVDRALGGSGIEDLAAGSIFALRDGC